MKFATKPIWHYPPHLRLVATLPWEIKNSNFLQIFSRCGRECTQIAFWVHWWVPVSRDISRTVLWVCGLSSWLRTKSLTVSTFSSVRAQIDGKSKQAFYLQSVWRKARYFEHWKYRNLWMNNKVRAIKNAICLRFLPQLQKIWIFSFPR